MKGEGSKKDRYDLLSKIREHMELIAALFSGCIILVTWLIENFISEPIWIMLHILAFVIGGYAKAKEGITETIRNKQLNVEMLMIFAAIGSVIIGYWTEGAILIFIFALSGALETYSINKSNKAITSLMELQPEEAILIDNQKEKVVPVSSLQMNDCIIVKAGERIPVDGIIIKGSSTVDESSITGESIPINKKKETEVFAGTIALDGMIYVKVTTKPSETIFQKIIHMVQQAQEEKSPSQLFIERLEGIYVHVVIIAVLVMMFLPHLLFQWALSESIYRALVLLVVASPCALVASIAPATLSAISNAARRGVLFKGGIHIENLAHIQAIALDKTGTLTKGKPEVTDVYIESNRFDEKDILRTVGGIEKESTHPLAKAISHYCIKNNKDITMDIQDWRNRSGEGISAIISNVTWRIGKADFVGKEQAESFQDGVAHQLAEEGKTVVFVKAEDDIVAVFALKDTVRDSTKEAITQLKQLGIRPVMLTGDNELTAKAIAKETGIKRYYANCLPENKVEHLNGIREKFGTVAMVGDGINDAPALATASVGIAMGEGTGVALETADMVLMKNDLSRIIHSLQLSKRMNRIVKQNIIFSISVIFLLIISNYLQILDLPLGVLGHEGSTILVILNGLRLLK